MKTARDGKDAKVLANTLTSSKYKRPVRAEESA